MLMQHLEAPASSILPRLSLARSSEHIAIYSQTPRKCNPSRFNPHMYRTPTPLWANTKRIRPLHLPALTGVPPVAPRSPEVIILSRVTAVLVEIIVRQAAVALWSPA